MCGIFGQYNRQGADPQLIERMDHSLRHRGPDGYGTYHYRSLAFGAGRLAIIDLAAGVHPSSMKIAASRLFSTAKFIIITCFAPNSKLPGMFFRPIPILNLYIEGDLKLDHDLSLVDWLMHLEG